MQGKTHLAWGVAMGLAIGVETGAGWPALVGYAAGGALGGLIPDWLQVNLPGVTQIKGLLGHRGFSHWLWTPLAAAYLLHRFTGVAAPLLAALALGWGSHLVLDACSNGVPAFWPWGRSVLGHIPTGSKLDTLIGGVGLVLAAVAVAVSWRANL